MLCGYSGWSLTLEPRIVSDSCHDRTVVSAFGWLDTDSEQRRKMLEAVDLFKEQGTVDELGIASIRDALADVLFPGTSVLHTRLRYALFIPWALQSVAKKPTVAAMSSEFRRLEVRLIASLVAGGEEVGVIGSAAGAGLKTMPSGMYWAALGKWNIRQTPTSIDGFFRRQHDYQQLSKRSLRADDPGARDTLPSSGLDPHLPQAPADWLKSSTFELTAEEELYLSDQIASATRGSMFEWLIRNQPGNEPDFVWELDNLDQAPSELRAQVDHARRFSVVIHGAALKYNLMLAQKRGDETFISDYLDRLASWQVEVTASGVLAHWNRADFWDTIRKQNPRLKQPTVQFVDRWIDLLTSGETIADSTNAERLIANRERQIKGGRARLANQAALDNWSGESGTGRLSYRWQIARTHLADLYAARVTA